MSAPERKTFAKGTLIFKEGETGREAYMVQHGRVRIFKNVAGRRIPIGIVLPGQTFGELALLDGGIRMAAALAEEDTACLVLTKDAIDHMMHDAPAGLGHLLRSLIGTMRAMGDDLATARAELADLRRET